VSSLGGGWRVEQVPATDVSCLCGHPRSAHDEGTRRLHVCRRDCDCEIFEPAPARSSPDLALVACGLLAIAAISLGQAAGVLQ